MSLVMMRAALRALEHDLASLEEVLGDKWISYKALCCGDQDDRRRKHR